MIERTSIMAGLLHYTCLKQLYWITITILLKQEFIWISRTRRLKVRLWILITVGLRYLDKARGIISKLVRYLGTHEGSLPDSFSCFFGTFLYKYTLCRDSWNSCRGLSLVPVGRFLLKDLDAYSTACPNTHNRKTFTTSCISYTYQIKSLSSTFECFQNKVLI